MDSRAIRSTRRLDVRERRGSKYRVAVKSEASLQEHGLVGTMWRSAVETLCTAVDVVAWCKLVFGAAGLLSCCILTDKRCDHNMRYGTKNAEISQFTELCELGTEGATAVAQNTVIL